MRPIRLKMKAFGSYAGETIVDFESLTGGLYLIVGKTGAGKTTIFDAVSFALFGRPSGSERTADMLHSDFVPLSEDTEVALDFIHLGKEYHVERTLHFPKLRGMDGYGDVKVSALMTGADQPAIGLASQVTARCEELLGLNAEQFRRIVMLAQGEFREFLRSDSNKKNEILGRLFDNTDYVRFQNLLDSARTALQKQRRMRMEEIDTVMRTLFRLPESADAEEAEAFLPGHPRLVENLQMLVQRDEERLNTLYEVSKAVDREVEQLVRQEGAAETDNTLLKELEGKRAYLLDLESQEESFRTRKDTYHAAERALHRVKPKEDEYRRAEKNLKDTSSEISRLEIQEHQQRTALDEAQRLVNDDEPKHIKADILHTEAEKIIDVIPVYETVIRIEEEKNKICRELNEAAEKLRKKEEYGISLTEKLTALRVELDSLTDCSAEEVRARGERDAALGRWEEFSGPKTGLSDQIKGILVEETNLKAAAARTETLALEAAEAEAHHHTLYQAFMTGQAGLLAASMERELAETGRTACPVCFTVFRSDEPHRFAFPEEHIPDQAEVDRAAAKAKNADDKWKKAQAEFQKNSSLLEQRKESVLSRMQKLLTEVLNWELLTAPGWLPAVCSRLKDALTEKEKTLADAQSRCRRREALIKEEKDKTAEQEQLRSMLETERANCEKRKQDIQGLSSALAENRKRLPFPDEAAAQERLKELSGRREALLQEIDAHQRAFEAAKEALIQTAGILTKLRENIPEQKRQLDRSGTMLSQALEEAGFSDRAAVEAALLPLHDMDGEQWLLHEKEVLDRYVQETENTRKRVEELTVQTEGKTVIDLTELKGRLEDARSRQKAASDAYNRQGTLISGHRDVYERIRAARADLTASEHAWQRINRLADLGIGVTGEGGKLSFDRYVMGTVFREVLEMANRRLNIMTGGRFELVHSVDAGRKNAAAGLEIEILDVAVGKRRPSASISGGEGFMVSLALALGLSDVVQSHAGGRKLDTLFIDEGFGTLDDGKLDNVITVLQQLTEGNRLVGIISHVDKLEESIPQKLRVTAGPAGSKLSLELS